MDLMAQGHARACMRCGVGLLIPKEYRHETCLKCLMREYEARQRAPGMAAWWEWNRNCTSDRLEVRP